MSGGCSKRGVAGRADCRVRGMRTTCRERPRTAGRGRPWQPCGRDASASRHLRLGTRPWFGCMRCAQGRPGRCCVWSARPSRPSGAAPVYASPTTHHTQKHIIPQPHRHHRGIALGSGIFHRKTKGCRSESSMRQESLIRSSQVSLANNCFDPVFLTDVMCWSHRALAQLNLVLQSFVSKLHRRNMHLPAMPDK